MNIGYRSKAQRVLAALMLGHIVCSAVAEETKSPRKEGYIRKEINGPVLDPVEAISRMHVADSFKLNLFAAEPQVINLVVMRFDHLGRLWVVEMVGYMNDLKGTKELEKITNTITYIRNSWGNKG